MFKQVLEKAKGAEFPQYVLRQCWEAKFKTDAELVAAVENYTSRGMFCRIYDVNVAPLTIEQIGREQREQRLAAGK